MIDSLNDVICLSYITNASGEKYDDLIKKERFGASLASFRLQVKPALRAAEALGYKPNLWSLHSRDSEVIEDISTPKICFVAKMSTHEEDDIDGMIMANLSFIARLKAKKIPIVLMYSDNLIEKQGLIGNFYMDLFYYADSIVYPCEELKRLSQARIQAKAKEFVINDPWQVSKLYPYKKKIKNAVINICWFGATVNTYYLCTAIQQIANSTCVNKLLRFIVLGSSETHQILRRFMASIEAPLWRIDYIEWNIDQQPEQLETILSLSHIALIPSNPNDPNKKGVSHNRLIDAIRGGCIPVASPMASYIELSKISLVTYDWARSIELAIKDYDRLCHKYSTLRPELIERFNPKLNSHQWKDIIKQIVTE